MLVLGLAGQARSGKDTVAAHLAKKYGFIPFSFSDRLYEEVADAFMLDDPDSLRRPETKEAPHPQLRLARLIAGSGGNHPFADVARPLISALYPDTFVDLDGIELTPRQVLQWWGTQYRRRQDPDYWLKQATAWLHRVRGAADYPEHQPQFFVNTSVRFPNERDWIHAQGGNVWHLRRDGLPGVNAHESETPLEVLEGERELWNNDTVARLHQGVDLLLSTNARFVRVEPMEVDHAGV